MINTGTLRKTPRSGRPAFESRQKWWAMFGCLREAG